MGTKCSHNCLNQSLKTNKVKYQLSSSWFKNQTMQLHEMLPNGEYVILKTKISWYLTLISEFDWKVKYDL